MFADKLETKLLQDTDRSIEQSSERLKHLGAFDRPSQAAQLIEESLMLLRAKKQVYIDTSGEIHRTKSPFVQNAAEILFSAQADKEGTFTIYPSLPPRNDTYVGSGEIPEDVHRSIAPLCHSIVLHSDTRDWVSLTSLIEFRIPSDLSIINSDTAEPENVIESLIANAKPGDRIEIGRSTIEGLPASVSRVHVTLEILSKDKLDDDKYSLSVRVWRGKPSTQTISIVDECGALEAITGPRSVSVGTRLYCGEAIGIVKVPYNAYSTYVLSEGIYQQIKNTSEKRSREYLGTMIEPNDRGEFSIRNMHKVRTYNTRGDAERALKVSVLEHFIRDGLEMMSGGRHVEALQHFRTVEPLRALGYDFEENNVFTLSELTDSAACDNLQQIASRSWFTRGMVYPSFGVLAKGLAPTNDKEALVLSRWQRELAYIYAEEWTHGLQDAHQGLVSKKAALISNLRDRHEADVALLFHELGVPLSYLYVTKRYDVREAAFQIARGVQTEREQEALQKLFEDLPIGRKLAIGRVPPLRMEHDNFFKLKRIPESGMDETPSRVLSMRIVAIRSMADQAVLLTKRARGDIQLETTPNAHVYAPDERGYYKEVNANASVEPGAPFYIGRYFRFSVG